MTLEGLKAQKWLEIKGLKDLPIRYETIESFRVFHIKHINDFLEIENVESLTDRFTGSAVDSKNVIIVYVYNPSTGWVKLNTGEKYGSNYAHETEYYMPGEKLKDFIVDHYLLPPWYVAIRERGHHWVEGDESYEWDYLTIYVVHIPTSEIISHYLKDIEKL